MKQPISFVMALCFQSKDRISTLVIYNYVGIFEKVEQNKQNIVLFENTLFSLCKQAVLMYCNKLPHCNVSLTQKPFLYNKHTMKQPMRFPLWLCAFTKRQLGSKCTLMLINGETKTFSVSRFCRIRLQRDMLCT